MTVAWSNANAYHGRRTKKDDATIHRILWRLADRHGACTFRQDELAADVIGVHKKSMYRILGRMEADDRIARFNAPRRRGTTWIIADPDAELGVRASYFARTGRPWPERGRKPPRRLRTPPSRGRRSP